VQVRNCPAAVSGDESPVALAFTGREAGRVGGSRDPHPQVRRPADTAWPERPAAGDGTPPPQPCAREQAVESKGICPHNRMLSGTDRFRSPERPTCNLSIPNRANALTFARKSPLFPPTPRRRPLPRPSRCPLPLKHLLPSPRRTTPVRCASPSATAGRKWSTSTRSSARSRAAPKACTRSIRCAWR
jgi:hypothetical protein